MVFRGGSGFHKPNLTLITHIKILYTKFKVYEKVQCECEWVKINSVKYFAEHQDVIKALCKRISHQKHLEF